MQLNMSFGAGFLCLVLGTYLHLRSCIYVNVDQMDHSLVQSMQYTGQEHSIFVQAEKQGYRRKIFTQMRKATD